MTGIAARYRTVDELLDDARSRLDRVDVDDAVDRLGRGDRFVDIRPAGQRALEGEIPGALIVERNHLEWRLHPDSSARVPEAAHGQGWIVVCSEGYTSSLAADALNSIGVPATDLIGGFTAWAGAGLPVSDTLTPAGEIVIGPR